MFERFTDEARGVLVLAQDEARLLDHNFIGTEHVLLGLAREEDGVAAKALASLGVRLEAVREKVAEMIGTGAGTSTTGSAPFTPRAKRALEFSLREALQLGHAHIGTEHMLLGLVREGEGVAAQVLVSLGADLKGVRQRVLDVLDGKVVQGAEQEARAAVATTVRARCARCGAALSEHARYTRIEASPGDAAVEGQGPLSVTVVYCGRCGTVLGQPAERGPALMRPVAATVHSRPVPGGPARRARRFPDELLRPVRLEEVPEGARVDLSYRDHEVIEGTVAGTEVHVTGRVGSHRGPVEGTWGGVTLRANWRLGDNSRAPTQPLPGIITGRFGDIPFKLKGYFRLGPDHIFQEAEVIGDLCGQGFRAEVSAAEGGLGSTSTVVAGGTLGEEPFELFAAVSGDLTRAVVRGSLGGRPVSLDATHDRPSGRLRVVGDYLGPLPLLGLIVGTVVYFS
jgi:hypothetical protein